MLASAGGDKGAFPHLSSFQRETRAAQHVTSRRPTARPTQTRMGRFLLTRASLRAIVLPLAALFLTARQAWHRIGGMTPVVVSEHVEDPMGLAHRSKRQRHHRINWQIFVLCRSEFLRSAENSLRTAQEKRSPPETVEMRPLQLCATSSDDI